MTASWESQLLDSARTIAMSAASRAALAAQRRALVDIRVSGDPPVVLVTFDDYDLGRRLESRYDLNDRGFMVLGPAGESLRRQAPEQVAADLLRLISEPGLDEDVTSVVGRIETQG